MSIGKTLVLTASGIIIAFILLLLPIPLLIKFGLLFLFLILIDQWITKIKEKKNKKLEEEIKNVTQSTEIK